MLSVVTTLFKSAEFVEEFLDRVSAICAAHFPDYEIILVDDGSPDDSAAIVTRRAKSDPHIRLIRLTRNFGHHAAILAGLSAAAGDLVFYVDSDLEEPPEHLVDFWRLMQADGFDVVYGRHRQVTGSWLRRYSSRTFWRLFSYLSDIRIDENICHIRLMKREYVDALLSLPERNLFLGGLYAWPGFRQASLEVDRRLRRKKSTYSLLARIKLFAESIAAFSTQPLIAIFFMGTAFSLIAFAAAAYFVIRKIVYPESILQGFSMIMVTILFVGGVNMISMGIVGIYIGKIYRETKQRPRFIARKDGHDI